MGLAADVTVRRKSRASLAAGLALLLSACVTTKTEVFESSPEDALEARVQLARSYIGEQNWEDAKRNLKMAQDIDPKSPDVYEAFALVYQSTGEYELAEESFKRAISLRKTFSRARNNYAAFLYSQQRYEEAQQQLEIVVQDTLYESRPRAFINLGLCRRRLGDNDGARVAFKRALAMNRTSTISILELAHIEFEAENWREAEFYMESYKRLARQQSPRALWLGVRLSRKLDNPDAEASYALALRNLYPKSPEFQAYQLAVQNGEL
jgi:type IV pilus assembly protein PilF